MQHSTISLFYGTHFDTAVAKNLVRFNGLPATIFKVQGDSLLVVVVPQIVTPGKITVTVNGIIATSSSSFRVLTGNWICKVDFPDISFPNGLANGIGFAIGNTGYIGLGTNDLTSFNDLFVYDPVFDKWTPSSLMPIKVDQAFCMVVNGKAYVGTGYGGNSSNTRQFFEYDLTRDQ